MKKGSLRIRIPNPHGAGMIDGSLMREILRQAEISISDWRSA